MPIDLGVFQSPTGARLPIATNQATGGMLSSNNHGFEKASFTVNAPAGDAFGAFSGKLLHVEATDPGGCVWKGRTEDPTLAIGSNLPSLVLDSFGYWRAFTDFPYTALWSNTSTKDFIQVPETINEGTPVFTPQRFTMDTNNRLFIAPQKNANFGGTTFGLGGLSYVIPSLSARSIIGGSFDYEILVPSSSWAASLHTMLADYSGPTAVWTQTGTGALQTGTIHLTFTGSARITFLLYYNAAVAAYAGETGAAYLKITNLRFVSSTTNRINTTFTAARASGTSVTATVGSTARMYVGQQLQIEQGTNGETVTVQSVTNSTQFVATFARSHASGTSVQAHVVYADEVVKDILATVAAINSTQISSSTALIQSPGLDLTDEIYLDQYSADIITRLAGLGDSAGVMWEAQVWEAQALAFRPQYSASRAWYVNVTSLSVNRTLDALRNAAYAAYKDASGTTVRTATNTNTASVLQNGITRYAKIDAQTTSAILAAYLRDNSLANTANPAPRATIKFTRIYDASGALWPSWIPRAGDTLTIRNLPPSGNAIVDRIRTFRMSRTEYDADNDALSPELELPPALLDAQVAQNAVRL